METGVYTLVLAKEDFKFSSGHFTLFGAEEAEPMHGHNYQVAVELVGSRLDGEGLLANFVEVKGAIRAACAELDSLTLLPEHSPHLSLEDKGDGLEVRYRDKVYVLPRQDVVVLPMANTSIELLALYLWRRLTDELDLGHLDSLGVHVSETAGQGCWYRAPVPRR